MTILEERTPAEVSEVLAPSSGLGDLQSPRWAAGERAARPAQSPAADRVAQQLRLVRIARACAVSITLLIAAGSFVLSFSSLWDLAARMVWPAHLAWLWPVIVDGLIILATIAIVALSAYDGQKRNRVFLWLVLSSSAVVSVSGNAIHALLPHMAGQAGPVGGGSWLAAAIACVPPCALLVCTHVLAILWRFRPQDLAEEAPEGATWGLTTATDQQGDLAAALEATIRGRGKLTGLPEGKIAEVVRLLYTERPDSLRGIGRQVGLHHDKVGGIRDAVADVLGGGGAADSDT